MKKTNLEENKSNGNGKNVRKGCEMIFNYVSHADLPLCFRYMRILQQFNDPLSSFGSCIPFFGPIRLLPTSSQVFLICLNVSSLPYGLALCFFVTRDFTSCFFEVFKAKCFSPIFLIPVEQKRVAHNTLLYIGCTVRTHA